MTGLRTGAGLRRSVEPADKALDAQARQIETLGDAIAEKADASSLGQKLDRAALDEPTATSLITARRVTRNNVPTNIKLDTLLSSYRLPIEYFGGGDGLAGDKNGDVLNYAQRDGARSLVFGKKSYKLSGALLGEWDIDPNPDTNPETSSQAVKFEGWTIDFNEFVNDDPGRRMFTVLKVRKDKGDPTRSNRLTGRLARCTSTAGEGLWVDETLAHTVIDIVEFTTSSLIKPLIGGHPVTGAFTNCHFFGRKWQQPKSAQVPAFWLDSATSSFNSNVVDIAQIFCSVAQPFYSIHSRGVSTNKANIFRQLSSEYAFGGMLHMSGARGLTLGAAMMNDMDGSQLVNPAIWTGSYDAYLAARPGYTATPGYAVTGYVPRTGTGSRDVRLDSYVRDGASTPAAGIADVDFADTEYWSYDYIGAQSAARQVTVRCGTGRGIRGREDNATVLGFDPTKHSRVATAELRSPTAIINGALSAGSAAVTGAVAAGSVAVTNAVTGASASVSGAVTAGTVETGNLKITGGSPGLLRTIASDAITLDAAATGPIIWRKVETEALAATDDLRTITGGYAGQILVLSTVASARDVTLIHSATLLLDGGTAKVLDRVEDSIMLMCTAPNEWRQIAFTNAAS